MLIVYENHRPPADMYRGLWWKLINSLPPEKSAASNIEYPYIFSEGIISNAALFKFLSGVFRMVSLVMSVFALGDILALVKSAAEPRTTKIHNKNSQQKFPIWFHQIATSQCAI